MLEIPSHLLILTGPTLNLPVWPVLTVSRVIIYLYLNTHEAYTGKEITTQEKTRLYTEALKSLKITKEYKKTKLDQAEALEVTGERHRALNI